MRKWINLFEAALNEGKAEWAQVRGDDVVVVSNPIRAELARRIAGTDFGMMRGMEMYGDIFIWDAADASHRDMSRALGGTEYTPFIFSTDLDRLQNESDWARESYYQSGDYYILMDDALVMNDEFVRLFPNPVFLTGTQSPAVASEID